MAASLMLTLTLTLTLLFAPPRCAQLAGVAGPRVAGTRVLIHVAARLARPMWARSRPGLLQGLFDPFVAAGHVQRVLLQRIGRVQDRLAFRTTEKKDHRA